MTAEAALQAGIGQDQILCIAAANGSGGAHRF